MAMYSILTSLTIVLCVTVVHAQQDLLKEQFCQSQLKNCPFSQTSTSKNCVYQFCQGGPYSWGSCVTAGPGSYPGFPGAAAQCCASTDPATCLATIQKGLGSGGGSSVTVTGPCGTISSIVASCVSASASAYITAAATAKAQCLCYDASSKYVGSVWDNAESSCLKVGSTVFPGWWSAVSSDGANWCANHVPSTVAGSSSSSGPTVRTTSAASGGSSGQTSMAVQTATGTAATATASGAGGKILDRGCVSRTFPLLEAAVVIIMYGYVL